MTAIGLSERFKALRVPPAWWKREAEAGRMPCFRIGRRILFDPEAVEAELKRRAQRPFKIEASASNMLNGSGNIQLSAAVNRYVEAVDSGNRQAICKAVAGLRKLGIRVTRAKPSAVKQ